MHFRLKSAALSGIVSMVIVVPFAVLSAFKEFNKLPQDGLYLYFVLLVLLSISFIIVMLGYRIIGRMLKSALLVISVDALIVFTIITSALEVLSILTGEISWIVSVIVLIIGGIAQLFLGVSLIELKNKLFPSAFTAGIFSIIVGAAYSSIIFAPIGLLLELPSELFLCLVLFDASKKFETPQDPVVQYHA